MQAPSLLFSLLLGALLIGLCMSRPPKVHQRRHQLRQSGNCSEASYICNDGSCIPDFYKCDKWIDCIGGEDEVGCACDPLDFKCNDGICISSSFQCDGVPMCLGGEDEAGCGCLSNQFTCNDGRCIPGSFKCDKWIDCNKGEDEIGCACDPLDFKCNDGICILPEMECDGNLMCLGGEDEADCGCLSDEFTCNDGTCIPGSFKCDTWTDCSGGEDEIGCAELPTTAYPTSSAYPPYIGNCPAGQFPCVFSDDCITYFDLCDGEADCTFGEDEFQFVCDIFGGSKRATKTGRNKMMRKVKSRPSKKALRK